MHCLTSVHQDPCRLEHTGPQEHRLLEHAGPREHCCSRVRRTRGAMPPGAHGARGALLPKSTRGPGAMPPGAHGASGALSSGAHGAQGALLLKSMQGPGSTAAQEHTGSQEQCLQEDTGPREHCGLEHAGSREYHHSEHTGPLLRSHQAELRSQWGHSLLSSSAVPSSPISAAAAAKSLQSYPTLCDPIDGSPAGSPIPGILQARTLEWVAISFSNACMKGKVKVKSCPTLCNPMD